MVLYQIYSNQRRKKTTNRLGSVCLDQIVIIWFKNKDCSELWKNVCYCFRTCALQPSYDKTHWYGKGFCFKHPRISCFHLVLASTSRKQSGRLQYANAIAHHYFSDFTDWFCFYSIKGWGLLIALCCFKLTMFHSTGKKIMNPKEKLLNFLTLRNTLPHQ